MSRQTPIESEFGHLSDTAIPPPDGYPEGLAHSMALEEPVDFEMLGVDCGTENDVVMTAKASKEHLQKMKMRCQSMLQQVAAAEKAAIENEEREAEAQGGSKKDSIKATKKSENSPKPRTSFGGA
jgi:hypothetical protein